VSSAPLFILLVSPEHEKIQMAAMMASVGAVSDRKVTMLVSMNALPVFERDLPVEEAYKGGRLSDAMKDKGVPDAINLLQMGKELGEMEVYACSMALDVLEWQTDNLTEGLFDGHLGLTKFLVDAEDGQIVTL
jgi:peroxiredoxin family protein